MTPRGRRLAVVTAGLLAVLALAGCGGSGSSSPSSGSATVSSGGGGSLVGDLSGASVEIDGPDVVAKVHVKEGGVAGRHLTLKWGLVDAESGTRASESERTIKSYETTAAATEDDVTLRFKKPTVPTDYIVHFALYKPDGSYLDSQDTDVFTIGD